MANYNEFKQIVNTNLPTNAAGLITAARLRDTLTSLADILKEGWLFAGMVQPQATASATLPIPDAPVFYLANTAGTYAQFRVEEPYVLTNTWGLFYSQQSVWRMIVLTGLPIGTPVTTDELVTALREAILASPDLQLLIRSLVLQNRVDNSTLHAVTSGAIKQYIDTIEGALTQSIQECQKPLGLISDLTNPSNWQHFANTYGYLPIPNETITVDQTIVIDGDCTIYGTGSKSVIVQGDGDFGPVFRVVQGQVTFKNITFLGAEGHTYTLSPSGYFTTDNESFYIKPDTTRLEWTGNTPSRWTSSSVLRVTNHNLSSIDNRAIYAVPASNRELSLTIDNVSFQKFLGEAVRLNGRQEEYGTPIRYKLSNLSFSKSGVGLWAEEGQLNLQADNLCFDTCGVGVVNRGGNVVFANLHLVHCNIGIAEYGGYFHKNIAYNNINIYKPDTGIINYQTPVAASIEYTNITIDSPNVIAFSGNEAANIVINNITTIVGGRDNIFEWRQHSGYKCIASCWKSNHLPATNPPAGLSIVDITEKIIVLD